MFWYLFIYLLAMDHLVFFDAVDVDADVDVDVALELAVAVLEEVLLAAIMN